MQIKIPFVQNLTLSRSRITCRRMVVLFGLLIVGSVCICTLSIFFNRKQLGVPQMPLPIGTLIFTNHYAIFKLDSENSTEETFATVFTTTVSSPISSPKLHPDHSKILFEWSKKLPEAPADPGVSSYYPRALHLLDVAGGQSPGLLWRAHDSYEQDGDPEPYSSAWTADGQVVTLMEGDIFKLDPDTLMMEQIYDCDPDCRSVTPAPVSDRLLFTSLLFEDNRRLKGGIISSLEGNGTARNLFEDAGIDYLTKPSWSPDESQIAFSMKVNDLDWRGIFLLNTEGTNLVRLTQEEDAYYHTPVWSPDGKMLAFVKQEWYGESGVASFIVLIDLQTKEMETLISAPWDWNDLQWVE